MVTNCFLQMPWCAVLFVRSCFRSVFFDFKSARQTVCSSEMVLHRRRLQRLRRVHRLRRRLARWRVLRLGRRLARWCLAATTTCHRQRLDEWKSRWQNDMPKHFSTVQRAACAVATHTCLARHEEVVLIVSTMFFERCSLCVNVCTARCAPNA